LGFCHESKYEKLYLIWEDDSMQTIYKTENNINTFDDLREITANLAITSRSNTESLYVLTGEYQKLNTIVGSMSKQLNGISDTICVLNDRMTNLELNEEITEEQAKNLNKTAKRRIVEILKGNELDMAKYFRYFILRLYSDMKKYHNMGSSFKTTKKRYYQSLIDNIEAWIPDEGIQNLKDKIDKKAEAKRIAREDGYID
jgi:vacuolar-type H+-ATPase subunit I/STV1